MPSPKHNKIYDLIGKPVASSTPIKRPFVTNTEQISYMKTKTYLEARNHKMSKAGDCVSTFNRSSEALELVTSESDSGSYVMPCKKAKLVSSEVNQSYTTSKVNAVEANGTYRKSYVVKHSKDVQNTVASSSEESGDRIKVQRSRKPGPSKSMETSFKNAGIADVLHPSECVKLRSQSLTRKPTLRQKNSALIRPSLKIAEKKFSVNLSSAPLKKDNNTSSKKKTSSSETIGNASSAARSSTKKPPKSSESSSDDSEIDIEKHYEFDKKRCKSPTKKPDLRQKDTSLGKSPPGIATKALTVNVSSAYHQQEKESQNHSKKITTPVTGIPPARQRQSLSRTLSRITASASDKFMVEIPKSLADSFSESLQLIKRRIDFEGIDEPEKQRINVGDTQSPSGRKNYLDEKDEPKKRRINVTETDGPQNLRNNFDRSRKQKNGAKEKIGPKMTEKQRKMWKSPSETGSANISRKLSALKSVNSSEDELEKKQTKAAIEGVRKSTRRKIPPISFWVGNSSNQNQLFAENQTKSKRVSHKHAESQPPMDNPKKSQSLRVSTIKNGAKQKEKTAHSKSVTWKDNGNGSRYRDNEDLMSVPVSFATFDKAEFYSDEGDENRVQCATLLHTFDVQSQFIRLLAGAETTDLLSLNNNQLYTVLENTVWLYVEDAPKKFDLHDQIYVCKGVSHKLRNKSSKVSLLQQVIIQK